MKRLLMLSLLLSVAALQAILPGEYNPAMPGAKASGVVAHKPSADTVVSSNGDNGEQVTSATPQASKSKLGGARTRVKAKVRSIRQK